jgi:hypothetical protein
VLDKYAHHGLIIAKRVAHTRRGVHLRGLVSPSVQLSLGRMTNIEKIHSEQLDEIKYTVLKVHSIFGRGGGRHFVRFFESPDGTPTVLECRADPELYAAYIFKCRLGRKILTLMAMSSYLGKMKFCGTHVIGTLNAKDSTEEKFSIPFSYSIFY